MQDGWRRRRHLEAAIGREALRRVNELLRRSGSSTPVRIDDQLAHIAALARRGGDEALEELGAIIDGSEDEIRFAARVAFARVARSAGGVPVEADDDGDCLDGEDELPKKTEEDGWQLVG